MSVQIREAGDFRVSWLAWVRTLDGLAPTELLVLRELALLVDEYGLAVVSMHHLASTCGRARRSVFRAVSSLEEKGLVRRERRRAGQRQAASLIQLCRSEPGPGQVGQVVPIPVGTDTTAARDDVWRPDDLVDNAAFRDALVAAEREAWRGAAATAIARCLVLNGPRQFWMALSRVRRFMGLSEADARDHVVGLAWEACQTEVDRLVSAAKPWAMLTVILARAVSEVESVPVDVVDPAVFPESGLKPGHGAALGSTDTRLPRGQTPVFVSVRELPVQIEQLIEALVDAGMDETLARAGTRRVVEIAAEVDPSRRHTFVARDVRLADLGVGPDAARAWMTLLAGSRRGTRVGALECDADELRKGALEVARLWQRDAIVSDCTRC